MSWNKKEQQVPWARYPALRIVLLFGLGIGLHYLTGYHVGWAIGFILLLVGHLYYLIRQQQRLSTRDVFRGKWIYLLMLIAAGGWYSQLRAIDKYDDHPPFELFQWDQIRISGTVEEVKHQTEDRSACLVTMRTDTLWFRDSLRWTLPTRIRARFESASGAHPLQPEVKLNGHFTVYPLEAPSNPGVFDYRSFLRESGIVAHGKLENIHDYQSAQRGMTLARFRNSVSETIDRLYKPERAALAKAIIMGEKSDLRNQTRDSFIRSGLAHIMAVSGLHVGILVGCFWFLIPYLWNYRWGRWLGLLSVGLLCFIYAGLAGFPASVLRASIMALLLTGGKLFSKQRNALNMLGAAGFVILLIDPGQLADVGFQLSFVALIMIIVVWQSMQEWIPNRWRGKWWMKWIVGVVAMSVIIQIGLLPLLGFYFQQFSVVGPLLNVLALPLVTLYLPLALISLSLSAIWSWGASWLNTIPEFILWLLQTSAQEVSTWSLSWISIQFGTVEMIWVVVIIALMVLLIGGWNYPRMRWRLGIALLLTGCVGMGTLLYQQWQPAQFTLTMLDVEQGDAMVVETPSGKHILIDAGRWSPGYNSGSFTILPYLQAQGIDHLDAVILSHPHADHIGGMPALLRDEELSIGRILESPVEGENKLYHRMRDLAQKKNIPIQPIKAGDTLRVDPQIFISVLAPFSDQASNLNEASVVVRMDYGESSFLFTGDVEQQAETWMGQQYDQLLDADVLKVGHHGSKTSSTSAFLDEVTPQLSLVSLGWQNRYDHPHPASIRRLQRPQNKLFYTSRSGAIIIKSDGRRIWRHHWR
ncbi:MAG: DNA internalization-related competence protein ComEC/Rec2 [Bacteroidota bacterium]